MLHSTGHSPGTDGSAPLGSPWTGCGGLKGKDLWGQPGLCQVPAGTACPVSGSWALCPLGRPGSQGWALSRGLSLGDESLAP